MERDKLQKLLEDYKASRIPLDAVLGALGGLSTEQMGFARVDHQRELRCGIPEVIFAEGKTCEQVVRIAKAIFERAGSVLATRVTERHAKALAEAFPEAKYCENARVVRVGRAAEEGSAGRVAVVSAGTSDIPVAEQAVETADFLGAAVERFYDVGVAGMHRLIDVIDVIRDVDVVIVVAGMEGALPSVVGGLVAVPVIGVPTSVGYGASFRGITALLGMLSSCASNVCVVNIDNGFGAGVISAMIGRMATKGTRGDG